MNVELGSTFRAPAYLFVAQPALSRQVQKLESALSKRLLYVAGRKIVVAESGLQLVSSRKRRGAKRQRKRALAKALSA